MKSNSKVAKGFFIFLLLLFSNVSFFGQEEEDLTKIIREVVKLDVDKAKFAPPPPPSHATKDKKGKKKHVEEPPPPTEPDTGSTMIPAPLAEVIKRAENWTKTKNVKFIKSNGANSGGSILCSVSFDYKQKIFNTLVNVDGKITMDVLIEAKEGKYRYTIKNMKHKAGKPEASGGDVFLIVPECGSTSIDSKLWTKIKAETLADAEIVATDLKTKMKLEADSKKDDW